MKLGRVIYLQLLIPPTLPCGSIGIKIPNLYVFREHIPQDGTISWLGATQAETLINCLSYVRYHTHILVFCSCILFAFETDQAGLELVM